MKSKAFDHSKYPNWIDPNQVTPYERNAKKHDDRQIKNICTSIRRFGWQQDTVLTTDNVLVIGHGRRLAALKLGCEMPYHVIDKTADELTDEDIRELRIADNQTNAETGMDFSTLEAEIEDLSFDGFDFDFGFDFDDEEEPSEIVEDEAPEEVETRCKLGDVWRLGNHRLICGDSTDPAVIDRLMDGVKAKLLLTDPPYGIDVVQNKQVGGGGALHFGGKVGKRVESSTYTPIANDDTTDTARANYDVALTCTENQIIFGGNYFTDFLPPSRCWIVWDKQNTGNFADAELAWTSFDKGVKLYRFLWNGLCREGSREVEGKTRVHPTQKPVGMLADILKDFSEENDSILDCFGGSGSTLIACEQLNRKCYMAELDEHYCDVILQRYINFKGSDADVFLLKDGEKIPYSDVKS